MTYKEFCLANCEKEFIMEVFNHETFVERFTVNLTNGMNFYKHLEYKRLGKNAVIFGIAITNNKLTISIIIP